MNKEMLMAEMLRNPELLQLILAGEPITVPLPPKDAPPFDRKGIPPMPVFPGKKPV